MAGTIESKAGACTMPILLRWNEQSRQVSRRALAAGIVRWAGEGSAGRAPILPSLGPLANQVCHVGLLVALPFASTPPLSASAFPASTISSQPRAPLSPFRWPRVPDGGDGGGGDPPVRRVHHLPRLEPRPVQ